MADAPAQVISCLGKHQAAVFDAADLDTELGDALEPAKNAPLPDRAARFKTRQDEYGLAVLGDVDIAVNRDEPSVARANRLAIHGNDFPVEFRALRQPIGNEQRLGCSGNTEIGELRQEQKGHLAHGYLW